MRLSSQPALARLWLRQRFDRGLLVAGLMLLAAASTSYAADHPAIPNGRECVSCHADRPVGKSVHFDFEQSCTVCHVVSVENSKTSVTLALPKAEICYACHEKAEMDKSAKMKGMCTDCHDPHSSPRPYLLLKDVPTPHMAAEK